MLVAMLLVRIARPDMPAPAAGPRRGLPAVRRSPNQLNRLDIQAVRPQGAAVHGLRSGHLHVLLAGGVADG
ncbi:MAG: hypothetical protein AB1716_25630, partial [Planctomycetota bacterium]